MNINTENKEICSKCGGKCCKKSGCDYSPSDFKDLSFNGLLEKLNEGNISIISTLSFEKLPNNKIYINPFLSLRVRNTNREVVDLLSMKTTCSMLEETGCKYSVNERPSGGLNLIPKEDFVCLPAKDPFEIIKPWGSYQKILSKLVKRLTGMTVDEKLKQDIEKLFLDVLCSNFDGVAEKEILEIFLVVKKLKEICPDEYEKALKEYKNITGYNVKTKQKTIHR